MWPLPFDNGQYFPQRPRPAAGVDVRLTCHVIERILGEPRLADERITVEVQNGVANLFGTVGSLYARVLAADVARSTAGVTDICNRLELARTADVTTAMEELRPDPFDELVAHFADDQPRARRRSEAGAARLWRRLRRRLP